MRILVTGATGKVGRHCIAALLDDPRFSNPSLQAIRYHRSCHETGHLEGVRGSIAERHGVAAELGGVTPSMHLAICKEASEDVAAKRTFRILELLRTSPSARRFILVGKDAGMGGLGPARPYERSQGGRRVVRYAG